MYGKVQGIIIKLMLNIQTFPTQHPKIINSWSYHMYFFINHAKRNKFRCRGSSECVRIQYSPKKADMYIMDNGYLVHFQVLRQKNQISQIVWVMRAYPTFLHQSYGWHSVASRRDGRNIYTCSKTVHPSFRCLHAWEKCWSESISQLYNGALRCGSIITNDAICLNDELLNFTKQNTRLGIAAPQEQALPRLQEVAKLLHLKIYSNHLIIFYFPWDGIY